MIRCGKSIVRVLALLTLTSTAQAVDVRSWDQLIMDDTSRYVVLSSLADEAVLDRETQLVWAREPRLGTETWRNAMQRCLNANIGNRRGWRLPSYSELSSLGDELGDLPVGSIFGTFTDEPLWTSSSHSVSYGYARRMLTDRMSVKLKTDRAGILCVRGVGAADSPAE